MSAVAFLMYHEVEVPGRPLCQDAPGYVRYVVRESELRAQIDRLKRAGFAGVSVGGAFSGVEDAGRRVAITFDDGCETDLTVAAPVLHGAGFGATSYVTVEHVGRRGYLSRAQLRELADTGIEIGSHGATHRYLHDLGDDEVARELSTSKKALEDATGRAVVHFSCPGGRWDRRIATAARRARSARRGSSRRSRNRRRAPIASVCAGSP
jgi:peptidoglycan/xylan/chitin deacetylase (PgdA/CDA1 family)